jgi:predicted nicotinamide N-methyase
MGLTAEEFILANTRPGCAPLVPELLLHLADEVTPLWQATEAWLAEANAAPPYWAFAWPGGQALARWVLDEPARVRGRRVLDFAAGCGIAALACARAGAASVEAAELDPLAAAAMTLNAALNRVAVTARLGDLVSQPGPWDLILCGDVCYEAPMSRRIVPWLRRLAASAEVWVADPERAYLPGEGLAPLARYDVPTSLDLEDRPVRRTVVYRLLPGTGEPPHTRELKARPVGPARGP